MAPMPAAFYINREQFGATRETVMTQKQFDKEYMKQPDTSEEFVKSLVQKKAEASHGKKQNA